MAAAAGRRGGKQGGVLYPLRVESIGGMARVTVIVARDVSRILSLRHDTVVAAETAADDQRVVHSDDRQEVELGVAGFALLTNGDVPDRSCCCVDARAERVATGTTARRALEEVIDVTVFARE